MTGINQKLGRSRVHLIPLALLILFLAVGCTPIADSQASARCNEGQRDIPCNTVEGFEGNEVSADVVGATISGGGQRAFPNAVLLDFGAIGGGKNNSAGAVAVVGGGFGNQASGIRAFIGGGANNTASRDGAVISGGYANVASQSHATISGGTANTASGSLATVGGGSGNLASGRQATVGGGARNVAESAYVVIAGGSYNEAVGGTSTISGGTNNQALGIGSTIGGGAGNSAAGLQSTVGGGLDNIVTDDYGHVAGGRGNQAGDANDDTGDARYATVGGGLDNLAGGAFSVVPGGYSNSALGNYSLAAGNLAHIGPEHHGAFVFADASEFIFASSAPNEFAVRATGGVRFVTALDGNGEPLVGVRLGAGGGAWESLSDRNAKTLVVPVDGRHVLAALSSLPVSLWRYKGQDVWHMGPMAQDFYAAFGLGRDERYIGTLDADGVALAAIQGLSQILEEKDLKMAALQAETAAQENRLANLEARLAALENQVGDSDLRLHGQIAAGFFLLAGFVLGRRIRG